MKWLIRLVLIPVAFYYVGKFCNEKTAGFRMEHIHANYSHQENWEIDNPPLNKEIFDQPFYYLGTGGQCYAFVSEDGDYVLKFFKHHLRRLPMWLDLLPLRGKWLLRKEDQKKRRTAKLHRDFNSYKIAQEVLPHLTGLLYTHLNQSADLRTKVTFYDKIGVRRSVQLDNVPFILQKKASLSPKHFGQLIQERRFDEAKASIDSIISLIQNRSNLGVFDEDAKIHRNFGFDQNTAVLIDVGRLKKDETRKDSLVQKQDIWLITERFHRDLEKQSPELAQYLQERLHAL